MFACLALLPCRTGKAQVVFSYNNYVNSARNGQMYIEKILVPALGLVNCLGSAYANSKNIPYIGSIQIEETDTSFVMLNSKKPGPMHPGCAFIEYHFNSDQIVHTADLLDVVCVITGKERF
jgi:hypothetical protein